MSVRPSLASTKAAHGQVPRQVEEHAGGPWEGVRRLRAGMLLPADSTTYRPPRQPRPTTRCRGGPPHVDDGA